MIDAHNKQLHSQARRGTSRAWQLPTIIGIMSDILNQLREAQTLRAYFEAKLQR